MRTANPLRTTGVVHTSDCRRGRVAESVQPGCLGRWRRRRRRRRRSRSVVAMAVVVGTDGGKCSGRVCLLCSARKPSPEVPWTVPSFLALAIASHRSLQKRASARPSRDQRKTVGTWRPVRAAAARPRRICAAVASEHATAPGRVRWHTGSSTSVCARIRIRAARLRGKTRATPARSVLRCGRSASAQRARAAGFV